MKIEDRERLVRVEDAVLYIKKSLDGNGTEGLISRVSKIEKRQYYWMGGMAVIFSIITYTAQLLL